MEIKEMIEYLRHHIPIIIQDDEGWCNADIYFENGTLVIRPNYNLFFDGE